MFKWLMFLYWFQKSLISSGRKEIFVRILKISWLIWNMNTAMFLRTTDVRQLSHAWLRNALYDLVVRN
jgi:hypothetical protein